VLYDAGYAIGHDEAGIFTAERWGRLTFGDSYYALQRGRSVRRGHRTGR
jgi:hypothetical protein